MKHHCFLEKDSEDCIFLSVQGGALCWRGDISVGGFSCLCLLGVLATCCELYGSKVGEKGAVVLTDLLGSSLVPFTFLSSRKTCALQWRSVLLSYLYQVMYAFMDPAHELTIFFVDM